MAPPSFRAAGLGGTADTTSTTITKPPGTATEDVLYALVTNGGAASPPSTVPSGWALVDSASIGATFWVGIYAHTVTDGGTEPANYTWSGFTDSCAGSMIAISGADTTTPTHQHRAQANTNSNVACASITTTVTDCLIIGGVGIDDNVGVTDASWACATDPTVLTERAERQSTGGADSTSAMATAPQTSPGATGNLTATLAGSRDNVSFLIAVQPPSAGGGTVEGTMTADLGALTANAVGTRTVHGHATADTAFTATTSGRRTVQGGTTSAISFTASAAGTRIVHGAASATPGGLTATAAGRRIVDAQTSAAFGFQGTATGRRTVKGGASAPLAFTGTATGVVAGRVEGTGTAHFTFQATATGQRTVHGVASAPLGFAAQATGHRVLHATGHADLGGLLATATGRRRVNGTATAGLVVAATATGHRTSHGTAAFTAALTATATGHRTVHGAASAVLTFTATVRRPEVVEDITVTTGALTRGWATKAPARAWAAGAPTT